MIEHVINNFVFIAFIATLTIIGFLIIYLFLSILTIIKIRKQFHRACKPKSEDKIKNVNIIYGDFFTAVSNYHRNRKNRIPHISSFETVEPQKSVGLVYLKNSIKGDLISNVDLASIEDFSTDDFLLYAFRKLGIYDTNEDFFVTIVNIVESKNNLKFFNIIDLTRTLTKRLYNKIFHKNNVPIKFEREKLLKQYSSIINQANGGLYLANIYNCPKNISWAIGKILLSVDNIVCVDENVCNNEKDISKFENLKQWFIHGPDFLGFLIHFYCADDSSPNNQRFMHNNPNAINGQTYSLYTLSKNNIDLMSNFPKLDTDDKYVELLLTPSFLENHYNETKISQDIRNLNKEQLTICCVLSLIPFSIEKNELFEICNNLIPSYNSTLNSLITYGTISTTEASTYTNFLAESLLDMKEWEKSESTYLGKILRKEQICDFNLMINDCNYNDTDYDEFYFYGEKNQSLTYELIELSLFNRFKSKSRLGYFITNPFRSLLINNAIYCNIDIENIYKNIVNHFYHKAKSQMSLEDIILSEFMCYSSGKNNFTEYVLKNENLLRGRSLYSDCYTIPQSQYFSRISRKQHGLKIESELHLANLFYCLIKYVDTIKELHFPIKRDRGNNVV